MIPQYHQKDTQRPEAKEDPFKTKPVTYNLRKSERNIVDTLSVEKGGMSKSAIVRDAIRMYAIADLQFSLKKRMAFVAEDGTTEYLDVIWSRDIDLRRNLVEGNQTIMESTGVKDETHQQEPQEDAQEPVKESVKEHNFEGAFSKEDVEAIFKACVAISGSAALNNFEVDQLLDIGKTMGGRK